MTRTLNRKRLEFATVNFLAEMRRQWSILHPGEPCPVKSLADYPEKERSALMSGVQKSIQSTEVGADKIFGEWAKRRAAEQADREAV